MVSAVVLDNGKQPQHTANSLHGYGISFKVTFEGELDDRNWVWDFGGMKRAKTLIDGMHLKHGWIICLITLF
jgi:6-pyruvoyl-tetrahydropterin synthase